MNSFKNFHPIVNFTYFMFVILLSMFLMHPVCLVTSLVCGFFYSVLLNGKKAVRFNLLYILPMLLAAMLINPAFNHEGATILAYLPSGNPLTAESIAYGGAAAAMLGAVICWFSCYNEIMTSDKFIYLFGRIIPSLSLVLSMALRFVPKFREQMRAVAAAQRFVGRDSHSGGVIKRIKNGVRILSVMITWAFENAVETADSMKSRGYGLAHRTSFSVFRFDSRDKAVFAVICFLGIYVLAGDLLGGMHFTYFPYIHGAGASIWEISLFVAYFLLCITPVVIEVSEDLKWKAIKSSI